jgi:ribulose-phosphate 3-epimerase
MGSVFFVVPIMQGIKIAPSILSADFGRLNEEIATIEPYTDLLHVDVMDGHFVPNITIGAAVVSCIKTKLPIECHLMIENPEKFIPDFAKAGASIITVHQEVCPDLKKVFALIKSFGVKCGVSINPDTPAEKIMDVVKMADMILVMSVHPGFGGQEFIESVLDKIVLLRQWAPGVDIAVDGGVNAGTCGKCVQAGANVLVAGAYIFKSDDRKKAIESLRE